jgi:hypothetical protein
MFTLLAESPVNCLNVNAQVGKSAKDRLTRKHIGLDRGSLEPWLAHAATLLGCMGERLGAMSGQDGDSDEVTGIGAVWSVPTPYKKVSLVRKLVYSFRAARCDAVLPAFLGTFLTQTRNR